MKPTDYPRTFGPYVLLERLGQGGMSEVDLARRAVDDAAFVRFLVIKRIHTQHEGDDSFVRMFHDEARINAELQHENIATVYDFGQEGDEFFLAMEFVPGCDLRRVQRLLVRRGEHFPLRIGLRIIADVLAGLDYAHSRVDTYGHSMNIVHRDVNPRNIMLSVRGEVKLIDFGVAKSDNRAEHTVGHSLKGKFAYMAPEQIDATRAVDGRADLFAVGIVLHELLVGASPFAGLSEVQIMHRILAGQIPAVTSSAGRPIPDSILDLHDRALDSNPDRRYRSAGEMRDAVVAAAEDLGGLPSSPELAEFVRHVDPDSSTVSRRLEEWRAGTESSVSRGVPPTPPLAQTSSSGTLATTAVVKPRSSVVLLAAAVGGALGLVLLIGLGTGAWWQGLRQPGPDAPVPDPTPTVTTTAPDPLPPQPDADPPTGSPAEPSTRVVAAPVHPSPTNESARAAVVEAAAAEIAAEEAAAATRAAAAEAAATEAAADQAAAAEAAAAEAAAAEAAAAEAAAAEAAAAQAAAQAAAASGSGAEPTTDLGSGSASTSGVTGFLNISSRPTGLELIIDGRSRGATPVRALELPVGAHTLLVRDAATGQSWTKQVTVEQGRAKVVVLGEGS